MATSRQRDVSLDPGFWTTTSWIQLFYGIWVNMAQLGIGLAFGFPAVQVPQLSSPESEIKITREEESWIASVLTLFSPIGCLISGFLMDKFGRRFMLIMCQGPMCIGWLFTGLAGTGTQIIIGRAITGIGCGMAMGPPRIFATEISLPNMRGVIGAFPAMALSMGISMQAGLGYFFAWQFLCFACSAFTLCNLLVFNLLPETPYFILVKGSTEKARKTLAKFRGRTYDVDNEMTQLVEFKVDNKIRKLNFREKIHALFSRGACKPFSLINTYILIAQASGISVILMWAIEILKTANSSFDVHTGNFLMALTRLVVGSFTSFLLFRVGRKPLALSSAVGVSLVCFSLGLFIHYNEKPSLVPQVGFMAYMAFASLGYYTLPFLMMSELYPLQIRGTLGGITVSFTSIFIFGTTKMFPYVRDHMGLANTIVLFGICSLFGTLFLYFFLPETKELTLQEIEEYYNSRRPTLVSHRRIMSMQMQQQQSDRSLKSAKSDTYKSSKDKLKGLKTDNAANLNMFKRDLIKSRSASVKEALKKTEAAKQKGNTTKRSDTRVMSSETIKRKEETTNNTENVTAEKDVKKNMSNFSFEFKPTKSFISSTESLAKYMEQDNRYRSKLKLQSKMDSKHKFKNFDKGPEQKLVIHSDESLSFYSIKPKTEQADKASPKKVKSLEKKPSSTKEQSLSIEPAKNEQIAMKKLSPKNEQSPKNEISVMNETIQKSPEKGQENKPKPSSLKKQKPDTKVDPEKEQGPKQDPSPKKAQIPESDVELSSIESKSIKSKESEITKDGSTKRRQKIKDYLQKRVTIESDGSLSDSEDSIKNDQKRSKGKLRKTKEKKYDRDSEDDDDDDDINKPSTSKSGR